VCFILNTLTHTTEREMKMCEEEKFLLAAAFSLFRSVKLTITKERHSTERAVGRVRDGKAKRNQSSPQLSAAIQITAANFASKTEKIFFGARAEICF
jgi:hypothetical protein